MRKLLLALFVAMTAFAGAARGQFCPGAAPYVFADVSASDAFCVYITWMAQTGVTTGCQVIDANNRLFCPDDLVTRKQMSAFMSRLGRDVTFAEGGNAFGTLPNNTAVLGTADGNALDVRVNDSRVMRYEPNAISPNVIGGSPANSVTAGVRGATIAGGGVPAGDTDPVFSFEAPNRVTDHYGTVGGGFANRAGNDVGTTTDGAFATVGGGRANIASGPRATVGGGFDNTASGEDSTVSGGYRNTASGQRATVGGGFDNTASGEHSTVGGGFGNTASGPHSTVGGGFGNTASGTFSWAGGTFAKTQTADATPVPHHGAFVWADGWPFEFHSTVNNQFAVRATGGMRVVLAVDGTGAETATCTLPPGGVGGWQCPSDRNLKQNFRRLDGLEVLARVTSMPVYAWNPKDQNAHLLHYGPTAQDFYASFGLGSSPLHIAQQDADGVALAAIQGLNAKLEARVAAKDAEIATLKREMADLRLAVEVLMARTSTDGRVAHTR